MKKRILAIVALALLGACQKSSDDSVALKAEKREAWQERSDDAIVAFVYDRDIGTCMKVFYPYGNSEHRVPVDCARVCEKLADSVRTMAGCKPRSY